MTPFEELKNTIKANSREMKEKLIEDLELAE
jgi:hypothetical protein